MSQLYTIIAIVGFSLGAVLAVAAVVMFFTLRIKQVRDDLTGKTAARSIAEIRSRAKTRKRAASAAAKGLGWEPQVSSGALDAFSPAGTARAGKRPPADAEERATSLLPDDIEQETSFLAPTDTPCAHEEGESATSLLTEAAYPASVDDDGNEASTTLLDERPAKKPKASGASTALSVVALALFVALSAVPRHADADALDDAATRPPCISETASAIGTLACTPPAVDGILEATGPGPRSALLDVFARRAPFNIVLKPTAPQAFTIPYGIDPATWISAQDIFMSPDDPTLTRDQIAARFVGGLILSLPGAASYPQPGAAVDLSRISWGSALSGAPIAGGSLASLRATMGTPESWMLDGVRIRGLSAQEQASCLQGAGDDAVFWTNTRRWLDSAQADHALSFAVTKEGAPVPAPDRFPLSSANIQLPDPSVPGAYPAVVYARASKNGVYNEGGPDERRIAAGQIVRLPVARFDATEPSCDGSARIEGGSFFDSTLYARSVAVRITCTDGGAGAPSQQAGLSSATLEYGRDSGSARELGHVVLSEAQRGGRRVDFSFALAGNERYDTGRLFIRVTDVAGNVYRGPLSSFSPDTGDPFPSALSVIVLSSVDPQVSLAYENTPDTIPGYYLHRRAVVAIEDENFDALRTRYEAMTPEQQASVPPVLSVVNTALDPSDPAYQKAIAIGDFDSAHQATIDFDEEGVYRLAEQAAPTYQGIIPGLDSLWAAGSETGSFTIDLTKPTSGLVTFDEEATFKNGCLFTNGDTTVSFELDDAASGIDPSSVALTSAGKAGDVTFESDGVRGGTAVWHVPASDSYIDLSKVSLTFNDRLGNANAIDALAAYRNKNIQATGVFADATDPVISVSFDNDDVRFDKFYRAERTATVTLAEASLSFARAVDPARAVVNLRHDGRDRVIPVADFHNLSGDGITWTASVSCADDGPYRLTAGYTDLSGRAALPYDGEEFVVDKTPPASGRVTVAPDSPVQWDWLFAPSEATVSVALDDAYVGLDDASVALTSAGQAGDVTVQSDGARGGTAVWHLPADDARIDLSKASLSYKDRLGNVSGIADLEAYADKNIAVRGIVVDSAPPVISVAFDNNDVRNAKYYNAPRTATVTLDEATFSFVRDNDPDRTVVKQYRNGAMQAVKASAFENPNGDGATWVASVPCTEDGVYCIDADFTDPSGKAAEPYRGEEFVVDTVPPTPGMASLSPHAPTSWNWLFAPNGASIAFALSDELSGIDEDAVLLTVGGEPAATRYGADAAGSLGGTVRWDVPADDRAISLSDVTLVFADKAGNASSIGDLESYGDKDLDVQGVFADSAPPVISVAFDNNDVRNAKYYSAPRTATVTLKEASFSFVRDNDPDRTVATRSLNGSKQPVRAKDFQNPSGDGATWTAQISCDSDGVYRIDADFTDPSGKAAEPYRGEEFVVDTTKPLIMLTFDNDNAENGHYFKAPRTATVVIYDDNFSGDLASVAVSAADAAGNAVAAPGITGWTEAPKGTWTTHVSFGGELHYAMSVACTDLAGNVASPVEEPEFVIDMTPPVVKIDRVDDHAAYKDGVAPRVSFEDTNFEPFLSDIRIVGAARGDKAYFASTDTTTQTSRVVDFADFPYKLEDDDIYTLAAKVRDKAGNEALQAVTFSVNRFGSNYEMSAATALLRGSYVKQGEDVVVTETNVSGLASSAASIAHNDVVEDLAPGRDYAVERKGGQDAWSRYTYTLPANLFAQDGYYRVMLSSHDAAGGLSENLMEGKNGDRTSPLDLAFAVDHTSPIATLGNVASGTSYYAPRQRIDVYAGDNMEAREAVLTVDGAPVASWDAETLKSQRAFSYDLPAATNPRDVRLEVTDRAGNVATVSASGVLITNNLARYVMNTPAVLYPLIAGIVVVLGAGVLLALRLVGARKARQTRART